MNPNEDIVARVVVALREGKSAQVGGGRCFATYEIRDGQPFKITSDDGYTEEIRITEETLRAAIAEDRELFSKYLELWQR